MTAMVNVDTLGYAHSGGAVTETDWLGQRSASGRLDLSIMQRMNSLSGSAVDDSIINSVVSVITSARRYCDSSCLLVSAFVR